MINHYLNSRSSHVHRQIYRFWVRYYMNGRAEEKQNYCKNLTTVKKNKSNGAFEMDNKPKQERKTCVYTAVRRVWSRNEMATRKKDLCIHCCKESVKQKWDHNSNMWLHIVNLRDSVVVNWTYPVCYRPAWLDGRSARHSPQGVWAENVL